MLVTLLLIITLGGEPSHQAYNLTNWPEPVIFAALPTLVGNRLYMPDQIDQRLKVYDISGGLDAPPLLWQTPGAGPGPGEIPRGADFVNIAIHPKTKEVWVGHRHGFAIFDHNGQFLRNVKQPYNNAWIAIHDNTLVMTSRNPLRFRDLLTAVQFGQKEIRWTTAYPHGIPINRIGAFIEANDEVHHLFNRWIAYDAVLGRCLAVDSKGNILWLKEFQRSMWEVFTIEDYEDDFEYGKGPIRTSGTDRGYAGMVAHQGKLWTLKLQFPTALTTAKGERFVAEKFENGWPYATRTLVALDPATGEEERELLHPLSRKAIYLVGVVDNQFLFLEAEEGEWLYTTDLDAWQPVAQD